MKDIWWKTIPNSVRFIEDIKNSLCSSENVFISFPKSVPWYEHISAIIQKRAEEKCREIVNVFNDDDFQDTDPGRFIINRYFKPEIRDEYRSSMGYEKFISKRDKDSRLGKTIVWIRTNKEKKAQKWLEFVNNYYNICKKNTTYQERGLFIIEYIGSLKIKNTLICHAINWEDYFQLYDVGLLSRIVVSDFPFEPVFKDYISELILTICGNNVEFAAELLQEEDFVENPNECAQKVMSEKRDSKGNTFRININENNIWQSQLRVFFPMIEKYRTYFLETYRSFFPEEICIERPYGEDVTELMNLEFSDIYYMAKNGIISLPQDIAENIRFLRNRRNDLAHMRIIYFSDLKKLYEMTKEESTLL